MRFWRRRRPLAFTGLVNFRDLGGKPADGGTVRSGVLFRSDSLAYATPGDADRLVRDLGLSTVIDLRGEYEVSQLGRGLLADAPVDYYPAPIADVSGAEDLVGHYVAMLTEKGPVLAATVRHLSCAGTLPAVFHCEAGCDRTGVLAAVVLGLLGVPDDTIAADYAATAAAMPTIHQRVAVVVDRLGLPPRPVTLPAWEPDAALMTRMLDVVRERWGDMEGWAKSYGLNCDDLTALRKHLVVPA
ncbi:tyrosine-protein phosphatase [Dactylosporangium matsuzakiense]|uniref:Protein-tyrosine-phosphatase n=1 Tax=Dactylosporangium matsuzakiense TaxID=53360 RepID=A0A9W6KI36_9ACTN|nr:tyrosine-protein phosphatase [Dactylosporangium matsuzakiense]UWZ43998.1 tyrosine-protein phosphatase [Dactylosporangium matsuzakiense]GLL00681.1 protein-tyrosine-phosphatase [Dactylosporangium matsuzakiense]